MFVHETFHVKITQHEYIMKTDLDVSPGDWQDGAGAPGGGADGAQRAAGVDRLHGHHGVARQEGGEVGLPVEEQINVMRTYAGVWVCTLLSLSGLHLCQGAKCTVNMFGCTGTNQH